MIEEHETAELVDVANKRAVTANDSDHSQHGGSYFGNDEEYLNARTLSTGAMASLFFAITSLLTFLDTLYLFIPIVSVIVAVASLSRIRKYEGEMYGGGLAKAAIALVDRNFFRFDGLACLCLCNRSS